MVDAILLAYLVVPVIVGVVGFLYAITRQPDRVHMVTLALLACTVMYSALAYELTARDPATRVLGFALGTYALLLYGATATLAISFNPWAWRFSLVAFGLHLVAGLVKAPAALQLGGQGIAYWLVFMALGGVGLWAALHKGTRAVVRAPHPSEA